MNDILDEDSKKIVEYVEKNGDKVTRIEPVADRIYNVYIKGINKKIGFGVDDKDGVIILPT